MAEPRARRGAPLLGARRRRRLDGPPLRPRRAGAARTTSLCHVSAHEADAHAAWAGARLPTEAEWELAAQGAPAGAGAANLDQLAFAPGGGRRLRPGAERLPRDARRRLGVDVDAHSAAIRASAPSRTREYAEVFFGPRYRVLRGGSWATQPIAARVTFRNWDLPERRQIFCGLRLARDAA